ncbi:cytochrome c biogenesis protein CcdA [bacterium]|nr:cytochrome c biogenesis protein CcdA [bacterium]
MFGEQVGYFSAFIGGLLSFLSPCVLPLIPSYLAFISGVSIFDAEQGKIRKFYVFISSVFFVLGFSVVFIALGATATSMGNFLFHNSQLLARIGGAIIIILGLITAKIIDLPFFRYEKRFHMSKNALGLFGSFIVGIVFAFGWSPCIGPILATILAIASQQGSASQGMKLLAMYSAGLAIPFLIVSLAVQPFLKLMTKLRRYMDVIELVTGKLLIVMGMMLFLGTFGVISETMGEVTLLSASILITFTTVAVTQVWILVVFADWLREKDIAEIPWSARLLFIIDLLSIALLQVINTFKQFANPE